MSIDSKVKEKQDKANLENAKKMAQLTNCVAIASSTAEGIIAFRQLMCMCGYNQSTVAVNPQTGAVNIEGSIYNAARENIWKEFRQLIPVKTRKKIEYEKTQFIDEGGE